MKFCSLTVGAGESSVRQPIAVCNHKTVCNATGLATSPRGKQRQKAMTAQPAGGGSLVAKGAARTGSELQKWPPEGQRKGPCLPTGGQAATSHHNQGQP